MTPTEISKVSNRVLNNLQDTQIVTSVTYRIALSKYPVEFLIVQSPDLLTVSYLVNGVTIWKDVIHDSVDALVNYIESKVYQYRIRRGTQC